MKRIFEIIQIGEGKDYVSKLFDVFISVCIIVNIICMVLLTFNSLSEYYNILNAIETFTIYVFIIEYSLRVITAKYLYLGYSTFGAIILFVFSLYGVIDLLSILPVVLVGTLPYGFSALRMLRVFRILKLFRITNNYDSFSVIGVVLKNKKKQIASSISIVLILLLAASVLMYGFEHEAQPDKFENALSGLWWAVNTMLTVGYGDIFPITYGGRLLTVIIEFLGVGLVAIPTGIISAGFMEYHNSEQRKTVDEVVNEIQELLDNSNDKKDTLNDLITKMKKLELR